MYIYKQTLFYSLKQWFQTFLIQNNTLKIKVPKKTMKALIKYNKNQIKAPKKKRFFHFFCDKKVESFSSFS